MSALPGMLRVSVTLAPNHAQLDYDASVMLDTPESLCDAVTALGFPSCLISDAEFVPDSKDSTAASSGALANSPNTAPAPATLAPSPRETASLAVASSRAIFSVEGMTCTNCSSAIESSLRIMRGVISCSVSLMLHRCEVNFDSSLTSARIIEEAISALGFTAALLGTSSDSTAPPPSGVRSGLAAPNATSAFATPSKSRFQTAVLLVEGMTCTNCSSAIETELRKMPGVLSCTVSLMLNRCEVRYDSARVNADGIAAKVTGLGFHASVLSSGASTPLSSVSSSTLTSVTPLRAAPESPSAAATAVTASDLDSYSDDDDGESDLNDWEFSLPTLVKSDLESPTAVSREQVATSPVQPLKPRQKPSNRRKKAAQRAQPSLDDQDQISVRVDGERHRAHATLFMIESPHIASSSAAGRSSSTGGSAASSQWAVALAMSDRKQTQRDTDSIVDAQRTALAVAEIATGASSASSASSPPSSAVDAPPAQQAKPLLLSAETVASLTADLEANVPGLISVELTADSPRIEFHYDASVTRLRLMIAAMFARGVRLSHDAPAGSVSMDAAAALENAQNSEITTWRRLLLVSLVFSVPVFLIAMVLPMFADAKQWLHQSAIGTVTRGPLLLAALTAPVQFGVGARFYRAAYLSLRHGRAGMDLLVVLGTSAAYFYSLLTLVLQWWTGVSYHGHDFFETSAILITTVCFGKYLENVAKQYTTAQLQTLLRLQPRTAEILLLPPALAHGWVQRAREGARAAVAVAASTQSPSSQRMEEVSLQSVSPELEAMAAAETAADAALRVWQAAPRSVADARTVSVGDLVWVGRGEKIRCVFNRSGSDERFMSVIDTI
jgi:copper ion binding protein